MNIIEQLEQEQVAKLVETRAIPEFQAGDTLRVHVKVVEGSRERTGRYADITGPQFVLQDRFDVILNRKTRHSANTPLRAARRD